MKTGMKILFVSRKATQCGVADYGKRLFSILDKNFDIIFSEVIDSQEFNIAFDTIKPDIVLYNYYCTTLPFITDDLLKDKRNVKHIVIYHESGINFTPDDKISTLPRPIYDIELPEFVPGLIPKIGSFGFGFANKNFIGIAELVKKEFESAIIRLNIPFAEFGDSNGDQARAEAEKVRSYLKGSNIQLEVDHRFLSVEELIKWLSMNDINLFLYSRMEGRGYASSTDYALSAKRPIGITDSYMFRHLPDDLKIEKHTIKELMVNGVPKSVYEENSHDKVIETFRELFNRNYEKL